MGGAEGVDCAAAAAVGCGDGGETEGASRGVPVFALWMEVLDGLLVIETGDVNGWKGAIGWAAFGEAGTIDAHCLRVNSEFLLFVFNKAPATSFYESINQIN